MLVRVQLTHELLGRVYKRLQHHKELFNAFERKQPLFAKRVNPHEHMMRFYEQLNAIANPLSGIEANEVFVTPLEAKELTRTLYGFEISTQSITTDKIRSNITADFGEPPPPAPRRKDYPTF